MFAPGFFVVASLEGYVRIIRCLCGSLLGFTCRKVLRWSLIVMFFIAKDGLNTRSFTRLRGVALLAAMSNWYMSCLIALAASEATNPRGMYHFGYRAGCTVGQIVGTICLMLAKHYEWRGRTRMLCFVGDIREAFDSMSLQRMMGETKPDHVTARPSGCQACCG